MKDYIYLAVIAILGSALVWQVFNPPECPTQQQLDTANKKLANCQDEKSDLNDAKARVNNELTQAISDRDAAIAQANDALGKVKGLRDDVAKRTKELNAAVKAQRELADSRSELAAINERYANRLALLKKLKQTGTANSEKELTQLLQNDTDGFLVLEAEL